MKVLVTNSMVQPTSEDLAPLRKVGAEVVVQDVRSAEEIIDAGRDADGLVIVKETITDQIMGQLPRCRVISRFGIGFDRIDIAAASRRRIPVCNVPDANYLEVATHTIAMALSLTRNLGWYDASLRKGEWRTLRPETEMHRPQSQTFGVIGLGRIGSRVARLAADIGFRVWAVDPVATDEDFASVGALARDMEAVLSEADVISLHVPLTESTAGLIGDAALESMKPTAVLINVSRGGLVDEQALAERLTRGRLGGAALDVFEREPLLPDSPLLSAPRTLFSPHAAHFSVESMAETRAKAFADVARALSGEQPRYQVNPF